MENLKKFQIVELILVFVLIIITPLLSTSHRSKYLYFILNILIILVGAEAGLLSFLHKPTEEKKPADVSQQHNNGKEDDQNQLDKLANKPGVKILEKYSSQKIVRSQKVVIKKSPSSPSIFFIESGDDDHTENNKLVNEDNEGEKELSGQELELFRQSETFIGNFYKQLKIQREESWNKLHDLYQKAF